MKKAIIGALVLIFLSIWSSLAAQESIPTQTGTLTFDAEAVVGWMKNSSAPPLVSTGLLGQPGTSVLLGGNDLDTNVHPGLRLTAAYWDKDNWGILASILYFPSQSVTQSVQSSGQAGSQNLQTPFYNVLSHSEDSARLSFTGQFSGQAQEELSTSLLSTELMATGKLMSTGALRLDLLGGFRYLNLRENFSFATDRSFLPNNEFFPPNSDLQTKDQFDTMNNFYGAQVGVLARSGMGPWNISGTAKLALGAMVQSVDIDGNTFTNVSGAPQTFSGGLFALSSNMGSHTRTVFAVLPEFGLNIGYDLTSRMTLFLGYTFFFTNNVVLPGDQIDRAINPNLLPPPTQLGGPARPEFTAHDSTFWAQGITAGLVYRF